jgi:hypothetical protein
MLRIGTAIAICLFFVSAARVAAQDVDARLTPAEILHRAAKAERITGANLARLGTITENGNTWTQLIVVKAPNKILIRNEYPWMHVVRYFGFDGKHAWTSSNFGGGGLVQPSLERYIKSTLAWYTSADMIPGRWPVKLLRLPDRTVDGRSYFAIDEFPEGGNPSTLLIDKIRYESAGVSSVPGRYLKCTQKSTSRSICTHEDVLSGGKVVGSIDIDYVRMHPEDWQFEMPEMLEDWTTAWLQRGYARALGTHVSSTQTLRGDMHQVIGGNPTAFSTQWRLDTTRPNAFAISQTYGGRDVWHLAFDGKSGATVRVGQNAPTPYLAPTVGMALNHCELHPADCGVHVTRLANVGLGGRWYYALGVTSLRDPAQWYTVLLDPYSDLPYALWLQEEVIYLENYVTSASGDVIPSKWTTQTTATTFEVEHVREIAP